MQIYTVSWLSWCCDRLGTYAYKFNFSLEFQGYHWNLKLMMVDHPSCCPVMSIFVQGGVKEEKLHIASLLAAAQTRQGSL